MKAPPFFANPCKTAMEVLSEMPNPVRVNSGSSFILSCNGGLCGAVANRKSNGGPRPAMNDMGNKLNAFGNNKPTGRVNNREATING